jgi:hypothetical protein
MSKKRAQKLSFVVPLASEAASGDWSRSCQLLEMGLRSFLALPLENAEVFVVGHDIPSQCGLIDHQRIKFVPADFSGPDLSLKGDDLIRAKADDKGKKVELGTKMAHVSGSEWVMFCDADDLVSNKLPEACDFESADAIVLNAGWRWRYGSHELTRLSNFHRICGTSMLIKLTQRNFPCWLGSGSDPVAERGHNVRAEALKSAGAVVQVLKQPLAVYVVENGCNYYYDPRTPARGGALRNLLKAAKARISTRRVSDELRREFSVPL